MQMLSIEIKDQPMDAPHYRNDFPDVKSLNLTKAIVVAKGTVSGLSTVDLQLETETGEKFVAMTTGAILLMLADVIKGVDSR